ncbi:hypothetical protein ABB37_05846 [Leptomonas pyrrhocoris]|uniref:Uncharacterized protein n=1 Tax=Leptomonas pyrrhocoris TaxID=157538 RepID=A0A0M9FYX0_LEPPY|nr:hypothetical protein ABB37_05846 [Leptomonas pyrrhocoris]KPA78716.1 hypothetical protein ABB37_05846 [Leptomonas pyrrhocoris]|eukprot:XP_015657155.1 hypothetical protein ABB37_05846 [Leptomonas pyrrhocoris]
MDTSTVPGSRISSHNDLHGNRTDSELCRAQQRTCKACTPQSRATSGTATTTAGVGSRIKEAFTRRHLGQSPWEQDEQRPMSPLPWDAPGREGKSLPPAKDKKATQTATSRVASPIDMESLLGLDGRTASTPSTEDGIVSQERAVALAERQTLKKVDVYYMTAALATPPSDPATCSCSSRSSSSRSIAGEYGFFTPTPQGETHESRQSSHRRSPDVDLTQVLQKTTKGRLQDKTSTNAQSSYTARPVSPDRCALCGSHRYTGGGRGSVEVEATSMTARPLPLLTLLGSAPHEPNTATKADRGKLADQSGEYDLAMFADSRDSFLSLLSAGTGLPDQHVTTPSKKSTAGQISDLDSIRTESVLDGVLLLSPRSSTEGHATAASSSPMDVTRTRSSPSQPRPVPSSFSDFNTTGLSSFLNNSAEFRNTSRREGTAGATTNRMGTDTTKPDEEVGNATAAVAIERGLTGNDSDTALRERIANAPPPLKQRTVQERKNYKEGNEGAKGKDHLVGAPSNHSGILVGSKVSPLAAAKSRCRIVTIIEPPRPSAPLPRKYHMMKARNGASLRPSSAPSSPSPPFAHSPCSPSGTKTQGVLSRFATLIGVPRHPPSLPQSSHHLPPVYNTSVDNPHRQNL